MSRNRITSLGDSAAILLSQELLDQMRLKIGDEIDLSVVESALIVRPLPGVEQTSRIESVIEEVFDRRKGAYEELAKGVE